MNILKELENYNTNEKIALFIRHADRDPIPKNEIGNGMQLNEKGKIHAIEFGTKLRNVVINKIYTSPVKRCVQTAERINTAYNKNIEIEESAVLGRPGALITDPKKAAPIFKTIGGYEIYKKIISTENIEGFRNITEASLLLNEFFENHVNENGITICISHDLIVASYIYSQTGKIFEEHKWIDFLDGIVIIRN